MIGYAVRLDGQGWRTVDGDEPQSDENPGGLLPYEIYTEDNPPDPVPLPPTSDEMAIAAAIKCDELLELAGLRIAPLQDAADLDVATATDTANLTLWKQYRIAVNRVSDQPGFPTSIDWPIQPT